MERTVIEVTYSLLKIEDIRGTERIIKTATAVALKMAGAQYAPSMNKELGETIALCMDDCRITPTIVSNTIARAMTQVSINPDEYVWMADGDNSIFKDILEEEAVKKRIENAEWNKKYL